MTTKISGNAHPKRHSTKVFEKLFIIIPKIKESGLIPRDQLPLIGVPIRDNTTVFGISELRFIYFRLMARSDYARHASAIGAQMFIDLVEGHIKQLQVSEAVFFNSYNSGNIFKRAFRHTLFATKILHRGPTVRLSNDTTFSSDITIAAAYTKYALTTEKISIFTRATVRTVASSLAKIAEIVDAPDRIFVVPPDTPNPSGQYRYGITVNITSTSL